MKKTPSASLFLILLLPMLVAASSRKGTLLGGWSQISDVKDPHVQEIGQFAVTQYNKQSKGALEYKDVLSGESQVVAGMNFCLLILAKNGSSDVKYEAIVWEISWENRKELTSFKPVA